MSLPLPAGRNMAQRSPVAAGTGIGYRLAIPAAGRPRRVAVLLHQHRSVRLPQSDGDRIKADAETMAAIAAGDRTAFAGLVAEQSPRLLRLARSLLEASPGEAEEVVQEALIRLWRQAERWQPNGRISTFLHRVAYRLAIDRLRRRRPSVAIDDVEDLIEVPRELGAEARLVRLDDAAAIRKAIAGLPERQRAALLLCHFQGLGQAEAAAVMGIGEAAYESLLARARRKLRADLAGGKE